MLKVVVVFCCVLFEVAHVVTHDVLNVVVVDLLVLKLVVQFVVYAVMVDLLVLSAVFHVVVTV